MSFLRLGQWPGKLGIVGPPKQHDMDKTHTNEKRDDSEGDGFVLPKELLGSDKTTSNTQEDDSGTEQGDPPADEERGLVVVGGMQRRRRRVQRHGVCGQ